MAAIVHDESPLLYLLLQETHHIGIALARGSAGQFISIPIDLTDIE